MRSPMKPELAAQAGSQKFHEVWKDDMFTGRRFTSLVSADRYAKAIGGKVRTI